RCPRAAASEDQGGLAMAGVERSAGRICLRNGTRLQRNHHGARGRIHAGVMVAAAHRIAAFVVVVMPAYHEVDTVTVEYRQPRLANALVGTIAGLRRSQRVL